MMKFNREEGLTLIELLITIAVIAIVAAISVPVITNVIGASEDNAAAAMNEQLAQFINEGEDSGQVSYVDATQTFTITLDTTGDGSFDDAGDTVLKTLTVDTDRFTVNIAAAEATVDDTTVITGDNYSVVGAN
jgi:prepilin-type N-terminal cleavage/methylation domain-containing protein